jgi:hypothetical protein
LAVAIDPTAISPIISCEFTGKVGDIRGARRSLPLTAIYMAVGFVRCRLLSMFRRASINKSDNHFFLIDAFYSSPLFVLYPSLFDGQFLHNQLWKKPIIGHLPETPS